MNHLACLEVTVAAASLGVANAVVNWRLAPDQLGYVLADSAPTVVFVGEQLGEAFAAVRDRVPSVEHVIVVGGADDGYRDWLAAAEPAPPAADLDPDDTCVVMYSSGTTGNPKGVELTHRNLVAHGEAVGAQLGLGPDTRSVAPMPLFHVGGTCYVLAGLHHGASTVLLRQVDPALLFAAITGGATHVFVVPAVVQGLLAAGDAAVQAMRGLRLLAYGAAPMPLPMLERALAALPDVDFVQVYGMTEFAGVVTMLLPEAHRDTAHPERLASAGTPIAGVEMRIVDPETLQDVEPGGTGEVWFRTAQAMKGYLGLPDATAETKTADGWLRTGDIGRVDDGGFVYIVDRLKDMIISGGENIYSPEVESVVAAHPAVADVAVIGVPDERWGEAVKAVVVLAPGQQVDEAELIAFVRDRLAHFKCPRSIDIVDELPRNPSGKLLKRELRDRFVASGG